MRHRLRDRLRRLFPLPGRGYQLYDAAVLVIGVTLCWYITTSPSETTSAAISETVLGFAFSPRGWGYGLLFVGAVAAWMAYRRGHWLDLGYYALAVALGGWSAALLLGSLLSLALGDLDWDLAGKGIGSALWFGYACRNLLAGLMRRDAEAVECRRCAAT